MAEHDKTDLLAEFMPDDPLMAVAWVGCLRWALTRDDLFAEFRKATGNNWRPSRSSLDQMIDDATGAEAGFFRQFTQWFNTNVWGDINLRAGDADRDTPHPPDA